MFSFTRRSRNSGSTKRRRSMPRSSQIEIMESRSLLAATVIGTIGFGPSRVGTMAANTNTNQVYIAAEDVPAIKVIDSAANTVVAQVPTQGYHTGITVDSTSNHVYVSQQFARSIRTIDGSNNSVVGDISVPGSFSSLGAPAVNPVTDRLYALGMPNTMAVLQASTGTFLGEVALPFPGGDTIRDIEVDAETNHIYVTSHHSDGVWVLDGSNNAVITRINASSDAYFLALNPANDRLYVSDGSAGIVSAIDVRPGSPTEYSVVATIPLGPDSLDVDVNPLTNRVYVAGHGSHVLWIVDGNTNMVVESVEVGSYPRGVAVVPGTNSIYVGSEGDRTVTIVKDIVTPANTPPAVDLNGPNDSDVNVTAAFVEDAGAKNIADSDATVTDLDDAVLSSLKLVVNANPDGAAESLNVAGVIVPLNADATETGTVGGTEFHVAYAAASRTFSISRSSGTGAIADFQTLLRGVTYNNSSDTPDTTTRTMSVTVSDGIVDSAVAITSITIAAANDVPSISTSRLSTSQGATILLSSVNISATDPDNTAAQLTYTASSVSGGQFELASTPGFPITSFTQAQINSGAIQFVHDGGQSPPDYTLTVSDGMATSAASIVTVGTYTPLPAGAHLIHGTLYIIGTEGRDHVKLKFKEKKNELSVDIKLNQCGSDGGSDRDIDDIRQTYATSSINRMVTFLLGGDDKYHGGSDVTSGAAIRQLVFGGSGNDHIRGGRGGDVLSGGAGDDEIQGGSGFDLLIGGIGKDRLQGGRGNDLLVGGSAANEQDLSALDAVLAAWSSGQLNLALYGLGPVSDDNVQDDLFGQDGADYLVAGSGDKLK